MGNDKSGSLLVLGNQTAAELVIVSNMFLMDRAKDIY